MNLRTLEEMKKGKEYFYVEQGGDKNKKTTNSYTGGESSGMAVENPDIAQLMEKAEKNSQ